MKISQRVENLVGSSTLAITAKAKELKAQGHDVVNFGAGEPDFDTPDFIKQAAIKAIQDGFTKYTPSIGTLELRQAISEKFKKENQLDYKPNQIIVSCGAKHSLCNLFLTLIDKGDEVLIPGPYWVSYPEMVKLASGKPKIIKTNKKTNFKLTAQNLEKAITKKTKVLVLNSPSNPTGILYSKEELLPLAEICVKHKIFIVSDEIYEKLIYDTDQYTSVASLGKDVYDLTCTVNGVSKTFAMTGWRIGYLGAPLEIAEAIKKLQDHATSNPTSISQMATLAALKDAGQTVALMKNEFKQRRDLIVSCLNQIREISYIYPQGAFYIFCNISKLKMGSVELAEKILNDVKVAVIPGDGFGADDYIRLSFSTSQERIQEGVRRIGEWIKINKT